jgi:hypothetical protein
MRGIELIEMINILNKIIRGFHFEKQSKLYEIIGVTQFKKIVPLGDFWINLFNRVLKKNFHLITSRENAIVWLIFTIAVECLHIIGFLISLNFIFKYDLENEYIKILKSIIFAIVINIYPIMVQRYNRVRILEIFQIRNEEIRKFKIEL